MDGFCASRKRARRGKTRHAFVVYETPNKEITSLVVDRADNIYAASIGEKSRSGRRHLPCRRHLAHSNNRQSASKGGGGSVTLDFRKLCSAEQQSGHLLLRPLPRSVSGSSVYKIAPDGSPQELWTSRDTLVYSLGL